MCGIAGFIGTSGRFGDPIGILKRMTDSIAHRGPDDEGHWVTEEGAVALGQRRLAIIDLSPAGHQPMTSACGRYTAVYNGEIYNFRELRREIEEGGSVAWRGHSDTEVMLEAFNLWGIEATLPKLNGMFAIAVWDNKQRQLLLARDRFGEKPLYYGSIGGVFLFGSELKALQRHPAFVGEMNRDALTLFLRHNYIPAPYSIWKGISKLEPATYVVVNRAGEVLASKSYYGLNNVASNGIATALEDTPALVDTLEQILLKAVGLRMISDVPLGAFLSGGIDSSLIVSMMQAQSSRPVKTFTIGFAEGGYNEAEDAKAVARHLGTDHHELYVSAQDALDLIPRLPDIWDEPFSDSSQIPTHLVSRMTREKVTVALSGDAGDELFAGYTRYFLADRIWRRLRVAPPTVRRALAALMRAPTTGAAASSITLLLPRSLRQSGIKDRLPKIAEIVEAQNHTELYRRLVSHFADPESLVLGGQEPPTLLSGPVPELGGDVQTMMYLDTLTYLPGDILTKVDRAAMAVSLEARVPFLDPEVVAFAWQLPLSSKIRHGKGKHILRELLYRHLPRELIDRPKMGFGVPIDSWLAGPLRDWAETLLAPDRLAREGVFDPARVSKLWREHKSGKRRWHFQLWNILMFQAWYERQAHD